MKIFFALLMLTTCLLPVSLLAQGTGVKEELLLMKEETVSIAARHEQPISQAASNVYVITDEDIRQSGATDIPTVLRRIPGIEVVQMTGAQFDVSARGDNQPDANKLLVLVDGRSVYLDMQSSFFIWKAINITLPEIKRIEVLKGPASSLYGFNAFDGVINIITKSPEEMKGTTVQFGGGEFGTITSAAVQAGTYEKLGYRLSIGRDQTNQWRDRNALAFRDHKFNLHTEYALSSDSRILVEGGLVDANRFEGPVQEIVRPAIFFTDGYARIGYERPNFFIRSFWREFNTTTRATALFGLDKFSDFLGLSDSVRVTDRNGNLSQTGNANTYDVEAQHALDFGTVARVTYGADYRKTTWDSEQLDGFSHEDRLGIYLQNEVTVTPALSVVAGLRYDLHTEIQPTISPRGAIIYSLAPGHTIRAGISVAYRPPSLVQTHFDNRTVTTLFSCALPTPCPIVTPTVGNRNLKPEQIISYELGYQGWFLRHRLRVRADLFFNHVTDLIATGRIVSGVARFVNDPGVADIYGGEAGVEFLATSWLTGFVNYSYEEISQNLGISPIDTVRRAAPRFKANAGLRAELENGLAGEAALHYVGAATYPVSATFFEFAPPTFIGVTPPETRIGSYMLLNLRAAYRFWKEKAEVAVSAFNALNDRHKEHPLGETIGSRIMGWVTLRF